MNKKSVGKSSKAIHKKPVVSKRDASKSRKSFNNDPVKKIITVCVVLCAVIVLFSLILNTYYEPSKVVERKIEEIARDYYENYYYDKFVSSIPEGKTLEDAMSEFQESGFSQVLLRHLLLFDNGRNSKYSSLFDSGRYVCDRNTTSIKITPKLPFGKKDYEISYSLSCNYK